MEKCVKLFRFSTHHGNSPDSRLFPSNNLCREERSPSSDGIGPVSPLLWSCSCERLESCLSSDGIDPLRLLLLRNSCVRLERLPSSGGISPVRLLLAMPSAKRLDRLPSSGGSVPFSGPPEGALVMKIDWTRCGVPPNPIPSQSGIAVVAFQFMVLVPRRVSLAAQRTLQSAMSPVFVWSDTTVVVSHGCVCPRTSNNSWPEMRRSANRMAAAPAAIPHRMGRLDGGG